MRAALESDLATGWLDTPAILPGLVGCVHARLYAATKHYHRAGPLEVNWRGIMSAVEGARVAVVVDHSHRKGGELVEERGLVVIGSNRPPSGDDAPPVWLCDGTGSLEDLGRIVPGIVDRTPRMRLVDRQRVRQLTTGDVTQGASPAAAVKKLGGVLADNPHWQRAGVICWRKHRQAVDEFRQAGGLGERINLVTHFASGLDRASNVWVEGGPGQERCDGIVVLGTFRQGEGAVRVHLLRTGRHKAAARPVPVWGVVPWIGQVETGETRVVNGLGYVSDPEWQAASRWLVRSATVQAVGRARAILADGCECIVLSSEESGLELAESTAKPHISAGVDKLLAVMKREQKSISTGGEIAHKPYMKPYRESAHILPVAKLAELLGVDRSTVSRWLTLAELRGWVVPVRGGVDVPGRGRGRGVGWRLVEAADPPQSVEAVQKPPDGVVVVGPVDLAVGETTVVGVNRGPPPEPSPVPAGVPDAVPVVAPHTDGGTSSGSNRPWTCRNEPWANEPRSWVPARESPSPPVPAKVPELQVGSPVAECWWAKEPSPVDRWWAMAVDDLGDDRAADAGGGEWF
jgi:hypothetical protein